MSAPGEEPLFVTCPRCGASVNQSEKFYLCASITCPWIYDKRKRKEFFR